MPINDNIWRCLKSMNNFANKEAVNNFANKEAVNDQEVANSAEKQQ